MRCPSHVAILTALHLAFPDSGFERPDDSVTHPGSDRFATAVSEALRTRLAQCRMTPPTCGRRKLTVWLSFFSRQIKKSSIFCKLQAENREANTAVFIRKYRVRTACPADPAHPARTPRCAR